MTAIPIAEVERMIGEIVEERSLVSPTDEGSPEGLRLYGAVNALNELRERLGVWSG